MDKILNKIAHYLQEHLVGEVTTSVDARRHFSTDAGIFRVAPQAIVYPRNESDVRKTARFAWQVAQRGKIIPVTARGLGSNLTGAAINSGIILVFPAHLNKVLVLDSSKGILVVQPGLNYGKLQQALHTHGLFLPPYPASVEFSTIGGAIANNAAGEKSVKYGATKNYTQELRLVLANGEVIATNKLSKKELKHKKSLKTFEAEIYRTLDNLLIEHKELLNKTRPNFVKNACGYDIWNIKDSKGNFNLTPLIIGSQGTLGVVTEIKLSAVRYNPVVSVMAGLFNDINNAVAAIKELKKLEPSILELVNDQALNYVASINPNQFKGVINKPFPKVALIIEFDNNSGKVRSAKIKKAKNILVKYLASYKIANSEQDQANIYKLRQSVASISWHDEGGKTALPIIDDVVIPIEKTEEFFNKTYELFAKLGLSCPIWGHAGEGNYHVQPSFDLSQIGDRQRVFQLMDYYYGLILRLGGSITGQYNDGRLRGPFVKMQYGDEVYSLFEKVKRIFDPYNILNPGVKVGVGVNDVKNLMRQEYSLAHLYDHMPRT